MTRSELVNALSERQPHLLKRDVELAVNCMLEQMITALASGERVEVRGFGSFNLHHHAPRMGRNPKTGESISLSSKTVVHFKPGKEIKDRVSAARDKCRITE